MQEIKQEFIPIYFDFWLNMTNKKTKGFPKVCTQQKQKDRPNEKYETPEISSTNNSYSYLTDWIGV